MSKGDAIAPGQQETGQRETGPGEMMGNAGPGMLAGLRVVEIADERAEYAGLLLAGLGAEVIKIEPPEGNATRRIGPFLEDQPGLERSLFFWNYNRNKKSVVLDLLAPAGRDQMLGLLGGAVGVALGAAATTIYAHTKHWATIIPTEAWAGGIAASLIIGALAGLIPALRAARLSPTQALRSV